MAAMGLSLIVWGLFKKAMIASELATGLVDTVFFDPAAHGSLDLIAAAYGYAVQIYCDFSAYSDMAIGLAALLGYRFPHNFNQPYRAASLQDFWRRWHISLSSWLRDYLYVSLGGSRHGLTRLCLALMTTMLLGGLWHGASWNFVIWGALHGSVLAIERLWREFRPKDWQPLPPWLGIIITFHIVLLGWIFFRATSFDDALAFLAGIFTAGGAATLLTPMLLALILLGMSFHLCAALRDPAGGDAGARDAGALGRPRRRPADPDRRRDAPRRRRALHLLPVLTGTKDMPEKVGASEEIERTEPERAPLPDPTGLAHTLSPVDLPEPAVPLPHDGLRWTSTIIVAGDARSCWCSTPMRCAAGPMSSIRPTPTRKIVIGVGELVRRDRPIGSQSAGRIDAQGLARRDEPALRRPGAGGAGREAGGITPARHPGLDPGSTFFSEKEDGCRIKSGMTTLGG